MIAFRVLIVDDHPAMCDAMRLALADLPGVEVVGQTGDGVQAIALYESLHPDLVLMDLDLPALSGVQAIEIICRKDARARVLALTSSFEEERIVAAIQAGACGYFSKEASRNQLIDAVRRLRQGESYLSPLVPGKFFDAGRRSDTSAAAINLAQS